MPGIQLPLSGIRTVTPSNLILDAGVVYMNLNETELQLGTSSAFDNAINTLNTWVDPSGNTVAPKALGATRDGIRINVGKTERQVNVDSRRTNIKGFDRVDMIDPRMTTNLIEFADSVTVGLALGSADKTTYAGTYDAWTPRLLVDDADYIGNISIAARINGRTLPWVVVMRNARVTDIPEFTLKDKDEIAVPITFTAHSLPGAIYTIPITFYVPTGNYS